MKTVLMVAALIAMAAMAVPVGAQERLADQLRKGIVEEETAKNLDKAIQAYQAVVARYDEDRKVAGTALFRLAECYQKTGKREQAIATYQRVVREFADQTTMVETSHQQLAALGADVRDVRPTRAPSAVRPREVAPEPRERPREVSPEQLVPAIDTATGSLEETELAMEAVQKQLARTRDMVQKGLMAPSDVEALQTQLVKLQLRARQQQQQIMLNQQLADSVQKEIALVQARIAAIEKTIQVGVADTQDAELLQLRRDLIALQRKLAELRAGVRR